MAATAEPTLVDVLRRHATDHPDRLALIFLNDGEEETTRWTYGRLDEQSRALATRLANLIEPGERVLLLTPASAEFAAALVGCLYSGMIAIPAYPPRNRRHMPRIEAILRDADARLIVTVTAVADRVRDWLGPEGRNRWPVVCVDSLDTDEASTWRRPPITPDSTAFLQYTSGSTGDPKGVDVTHGSLMANQKMIQHRFQHDENSSVVSWLPLFHDMGLVGNLLQPLYLGSFTALMPPMAFLQRPRRWFEMVTRYRPHTTGAPNFAYALCTRTIQRDDLAGLALGSLRNLYVGAEPIDPGTLQRFTESFETCGLKPEAMLPCYGMAETTLLMTCGGPGHRPVFLPRQAERVADHGSAGVVARESGTLVGCGTVGDDQVLLIVDPETGRLQPDGVVGEVWVQGPHVARGYWGRPELTAETFRARTQAGEGPFLRTGDLGLVREDELFVTGRLKDLIIVHGVNYYPSDIERTVARSHPDLQPEAGAAFAVSVDGEEKLVVVQEVQRTALRRLDAAAIGAAIRRAVFDEHELPVHGVVLVSPATVLKTSSGKTRRPACKAAFLEGTLDEVWSDVGSRSKPNDASATRADELVNWLRSYGETRINSRLMDERRTLPPYIVLDFARQGLLGLQAPIEHGGLGLTFRDTFRVLEQLSAIDLTLCSFVGVHNALAVRPVMQFGNEEQRRTILRELATGRQLGSFAFTEPGAGSNPLAITSTATPSGNGWILRGSKKWIGTAAWAGYVHVFAHLKTETGAHGGISAFIVPQGTKGFRQGPEELTMGMRAMVQNTIYLDDVQVGREHALGAVGEGLPVAYDTMQFARAYVAAGALGGLKRCLQLMTRYAARRSVATGRLLDNVISKDRLTSLAVEIAAIEAFVYALASWLDRGWQVPEEWFAAVKVAAPEALGRAADQLVQMLGGRGYIETNIAPQIVRDARLLRVFEGPSETMSMFIGARLLSGSPLISGFLRDRLKQPALATGLDDAATAVRNRLSSIEAGHVDARQRAAFVLGELGVAALWRAALEDHRDRTDDPLYPRASMRTSLEFELARQRATQARLDDVDLMTGDELTAVALRHRDRIGDIEQQAANELHQVDPLLQRENEPQPSSRSAQAFDRRAEGAETTPTMMPAAPAAAVEDPGDLERWLRSWIADRFQVEPASIALDKPFYDFGLDSVTALEMTSSLAKRVGRNIPPTLAWDYPTIQAVAEFLSTPQKTGSEAVRPPVMDGGNGQRAEDEIAELLALELRSSRSPPA